MTKRAQTGLSLLLLAVVCATAATTAWLARATPVIANHVAREDALHQSSNGVHFYDGGYIDDGDFVLLGSQPNDDYARGGVTFFGASEIRVSIMPWTLPAEERALIRNYALGDMRHREVRAFIHMLDEEHGFFQAGGAQNTVVLSLAYVQARKKDFAIPIDRYTQLLFERHRFYDYDWEAGIRDSGASSLERFLRIERDWANRFLRIGITHQSRVRQHAASDEWKREHIREVMGEDWRPIMEEEVRHLSLLLDDLQARGVRVRAIWAPMGSWQNGAPYAAAYREMVGPVLAAHAVEVSDFSGFLADDEFGDDIHARWSGQQRLHEAYRALALSDLDAMGVAP